MLCCMWQLNMMLSVVFIAETTISNLYFAITAALTPGLRLCIEYSMSCSCLLNVCYALLIMCCSCLLCKILYWNIQVAHKYLYRYNCVCSLLVMCFLYLLMSCSCLLYVAYCLLCATGPKVAFPLAGRK